MKRLPSLRQSVRRRSQTRAAGTLGWHQWLWQARLSQVGVEMALASGDASTALDRAQTTVDFCRGKGRVKYQALGHITAARALRALGRMHEAIAQARDALAIARPISDPALLLWAVNVLLALDGDDTLAREARTVADAIRLELPDEEMQRRFAESELVQTTADGGFV